MMITLITVLVMQRYINIQYRIAKLITVSHAKQDLTRHFNNGKNSTQI